MVFALQTGRTFTQATEGLWKTRALRGEGHEHPSLQDADTQQRDSMGQRQHEGWVPSQNASIHAGQIILHLRASQELPKAG